MGGGQANKQQASQAANGAFGSAELSQELARSNQAKSDALYKQMWGDKNSVLNQFLNGSQLNKVAPEGVYRLGYNQAVKSGEREFGNAQKQTLDEVTNRGFGLDAGASLDALRKNNLGKAYMRGEAFTGAASAQHSEALNNFWNANQIASQTGAQAGAGALSGASNAGSTYGNIYGTAGQYHQGAAAGIIGSALGAAGQVGAAAMTGGASTAAQACPVEDSTILMADGSTKRVQDLDEGDEVQQIHGVGKVLAKPQPICAKSVMVEFHDGSTARVSETHTFALSGGGYIFVTDSVGHDVHGYMHRPLHVERIFTIGSQAVYAMKLSGDHTYCADGAWSLE